MAHRGWSFGGIGTFLSIIIVYFIYKVAQENGWTILKWLSFAYLLFWIIIVGLVLAALLVVLIGLFLSVGWAYIRYKLLRKRFKKKSKVVDVEFKIKP